MKRRDFIKTASVTGAAVLAAPKLIANRGEKLKARTYAITMWDFSWLERRWPGAGYENIKDALKQLKERGYDAIRIDAYPHLISKDPKKEYLLKPVWTTQDWGSPFINKVQIEPHFTEFLSICEDMNIKVGLSTWWREDEEQSYMSIKTPKDLAERWINVLDLVDDAGLMDTVLYLDVSNEFPHPMWTPFKNDMDHWSSKEAQRWMKETAAHIKRQYPDVPITFSFTWEVEKEMWKKGSVDMLDFIDQHIWMTNSSKGRFYDKVGYNYERFDYTGYTNVALKAEKLYKEKPDYWNGLLVEQIQNAAEWSKRTKKPLATTECWGLVDYKDFPMLNWGYIKDLCALGTKEAAKTKRWNAIATSNFCGPQFKGMWRNIDWHLELTEIIKNTKPEISVWG